ncbi:MAG: nickel-dependent lactate racemase [Acidobacteriota bacterium]|nr:MAG: nickel-dependent lactate racemase [Acidobacteriota bacterium]
MKVRLAYGRSGLDLELPDHCTTVIEPTQLPGLLDEYRAIREACRHPVDSAPLQELVSASQKIAISICDVTRAIPTGRILPALLESIGPVAPENVTLLVATGTHRATTDAELERMLGAEILGQYRVLNHDCQATDSLVDLGRSDAGVPVWLNRTWMESDIRITVGFVEPHFFAGFSGGPKMVAPGLAGLETILELHSARLIGDARSTWGETGQNPIHSEIRKIAARSGVTFALDVTLNRRLELTGVFAGELFSEHGQACARVKETAMQQVEAPFDIVVTTNSGYPLDLNLYQSVKGMSAAARIVKPGGTIICAAECSDGVPNHGEYGRLLASTQGPEEILELVNSPGFSCQDQWQAQVQAMVQSKAEVLLKSSGLEEQAVRQAQFVPIDSIEEAVAERLERLGPTASICVLPEGPQTIPYLEPAIC